MVVCRAAWETTLHLLTKEVITAGTEILLQQVVAKLGVLREEVGPAGPFQFDPASD
jgi:hypothetical protein